MLIGIGDGVIVDSRVSVTGVIAPLGAQAVRIKIPPNKRSKICFNVFLLAFDFSSDNQYQYFTKLKDPRKWGCAAEPHTPIFGLL